MGAQILIRLTSDRYDDKEQAPFLGRDFQYEITRGALWEKRKPFLTPAESKLLEAPYDELFEDGTPPAAEPYKLRTVLQKVRDYLEKNQPTLAFEIELDHERMEQENLNYWLRVNDSQCWIQGDSFYYKVTDKVKIVNYPMEPNEVDLWVPITDSVVLDDKLYYLKRVTRFDKYKDSLDKAIAFCKKAEEVGDKIYWIYRH